MGGLLPPLLATLLAVGLPDSESKDKASEIIRKSDLDYSLSMYIKSLPKISVSQLPIQVLDSNSKSLEEDRAAIKEAVSSKCDVIADLYKNAHTFAVAYEKKHEQYVNAGIKVSPLIRNWVIIIYLLTNSKNIGPTAQRHKHNYTALITPKHTQSFKQRRI